MLSTLHFFASFVILVFRETGGLKYAHNQSLSISLASFSSFQYFFLIYILNVKAAYLPFKKEGKKKVYCWNIK